jgi:acyl dehydratase
MPIRRLSGFTELARCVGQDVSVSDWLSVDQARINAFADVTEDHQWIHVDPERAARETPAGTTVAHGFLTLSLLAPLFDTAIAIDGTGMSINYGFNRLRFTAPVLSGDRIRARFKLLEYQDLTPGAQIVWQVQVERENADKPALVADWIMRCYP